MSVISDTFGGKFDQIRAGDRIGIVCGPGEFPVEGLCRTGTVYGKTTDRFGRHLRVKMDDYTFETVHGITEVGIGAYLLPRDAGAAESPEVTGDYHCAGCGNREEFIGIDRRGYPGEECGCGREECSCYVTLTQPFTVDEDGEISYDTFDGGGCGAEIGAYTTILCGKCEAVVWTEAVKRGGGLKAAA
jgi:hypothetical protein